MINIGYDFACWSPGTPSSPARYSPRRPVARANSSGAAQLGSRREPERKAEPVERRHPSERGGSDHREAGAQDGRSERGAAARDFRRRSRATGKM